MSEAALYRPSSFFSQQYKAIASDALCVQTFLSGHLHMSKGKTKRSSDYFSMDSLYSLKL